MNQTVKWTLGSITLLFALETHALAQSAPTAPASQTPDKKDEVVELSPFVTQAASGWVANTTLIGNRTNTPISDLPITVDALTRDFLNDTHSMNLEDASRFVAGMTVVNILDGRPNDEDRLTYRGLANSVGGATSTQSSRNFFVWFAPTDSYNVERIDFNKGSNSLMFGAASPGGLAAVYTKRAEFRNFNESDLQFGSYNSYRMMLDFNRQITDKLAARFNYVYRSDNTYVDNTDYKFQAMDLAVTYRPFKNTEIRLEGEKGFEKRPRGTNRVNVLQLSAPGLGYGNPTATNRWYYTSDGNIVNTTPNFTSLYANPSARDTVNPSGAPLSVLQGIPQTILLQTTSDPTSKVLIPTGATATFPGRPRNESLVGKTDDISRPYGNVAVWVTQTMGKLVLELAYDNQRQHGRRNDSVITLGMTAAARPYFDKVITYKDFGNHVEIERATLSYPFDFGKLGTQYVVATGMAQRNDDIRWRWSLYNGAIRDAGNQAGLSTASLANAVQNNQITYRAYLDDPKFGSEPFWNNLYIGGTPTNSTFRPEWYLDTTPQTPFWAVEYTKAYTISSSGTYFHGRLNTLVGARYDRFKRKAITTLPRDPFNGFIYLGSPDEAPSAYTFGKQFDLGANTYQAGVSYKVFNNEINSVNVYANYSTSFQTQGSTTFTGANPGPVTGKSKEVGLKGDLGGKLIYTLAAYDIKRDNVIGNWSNANLSDAAQQALFNPPTLSPADPSYFFLPQNGLNGETRNITSQEHSKGLELTLQGIRWHGFEGRVTIARAHVTSIKDMSVYAAFLAAAHARTNTALAPGGNPANANNLADLATADATLAANLTTAPLTGLRAGKWSGSWLVDYELPRIEKVPGVARVGLFGIYTGAFPMSYFTTQKQLFTGGAMQPVSSYLIYDTKIGKYPTEFRLGIDNMFDLENLHKTYRRIGVQVLNADGSTIPQNAYITPTSWVLSMRTEF